MNDSSLPDRCCGRCSHFSRDNPDDLTAPEGRCDLPTDPIMWPLGYWPATLQKDVCSKFEDNQP